MGKGSVVICSKCRERNFAFDNKKRKVCLVCGGSEFEKINVENPECVYCKRKFKDTDQIEPAFYNEQFNTFYCGCKGWE